MKHILSTCLICAITLSPALALAESTQDPYAFSFAQRGDLELTCTELVDEANLMNEIIQTTEDLKSDAKFNNHAIAAAAGIGSFVVGTLTGGLGIAAAGFFASQEMDGNEDNAEDIQDIAEQRRALMLGIHQAQGCETPIKDTIINAKTKSVMETGNERLANIEPASGKKFIPFND